MQATASFENANNVSFKRTTVERIRNTPVLRLLSQGYIAVWLKLRPEVIIDTIVRAKIWLNKKDWHDCSCWDLTEWCLVFEPLFGTDQGTAEHLQPSGSCSAWRSCQSYRSPNLRSHDLLHLSHQLGRRTPTSPRFIRQWHYTRPYRRRSRKYPTTHSSTIVRKSPKPGKEPSTTPEVLSTWRSGYFYYTLYWNKKMTTESPPTLLLRSSRFSSKRRIRTSDHFATIAFH